MTRKRNRVSACPGPRRLRSWSAGIAVVAFLALLSLPTGLGAQEVAEGDDPLFEHLFAPELIMQHRRQINLSDEQRDAISRLIQDLQGRVVGFQWELLDDMESLSEVVEGERVDVDLALDRMDQVLETERKVKAAHLELLVRIKNVLTPDQQQQLRELRDGGA